MRTARLIAGWLCIGLVAAVITGLVALCAYGTCMLRTQENVWCEKDLLRAGVHGAVVVIVPTLAALVSLALMPTRAKGLVIRWCLMLQVVLALDVATFVLLRATNVSMLVMVFGKGEMTELAKDEMQAARVGDAFGLVTRDDAGLPSPDDITARQSRASSAHQSRLGFYMAQYYVAWMPTALVIGWLLFFSTIALAVMGLGSLAMAIVPERTA